MVDENIPPADEPQATVPPTGTEPPTETVKPAEQLKPAEAPATAATGTAPPIGAVPPGSTTTVNSRGVMSFGAPAEASKEPKQRKTLSIVIHDLGVLRAAYMQFIKGGGLFIPTKKTFVMGEDTNLVIRLLEDEDPHRVSGKVVWITPLNTSTNKAGGIGVEFAEDQNGERLRSRIETLLGPHLKSQESTHTM